MQIHNLKPKNKLKKKKRVGRGGKRGTYSGRGMKGQRARKGTGGTNITEKGRTSWIKRFPKLGGFSSVYLKNLIVKTSALENKFKSGDKITPEILKEKKLIKKIERGRSGRLQLIKILNDEPVTKKFNVSGCLVSKTASKAITEAGGSVEEIPVKKVKGKKLVPKKK